MSTKIYNGFAFGLSGRHPGDGFLQARDLVYHVRKKLQPRAHRQLADWLIRRAVTIHDRRLVFPELPEDQPLTAPLSMAWEELNTQQRAIVQKQERHPAVDMSFTLTFFPGSSRLLYGIAFTEQSLFLKCWRAQPRVTDYSYWNNTDPPDHLSPQAWNSRRRVWDRLLDSSGVPDQNGLSIVVLEERMTPELTLLARRFQYAVPSLDDRMKRLTIDLTLRDLALTTIRDIQHVLQDITSGHSPHQALLDKHTAALRIQLSQPLTLATLRQNAQAPS